MDTVVNEAQLLAVVDKAPTPGEVTEEELVICTPVTAQLVVAVV